MHVLNLTSCLTGEDSEAQTRARAATLIWPQGCKLFAMIQNLKDFMVKYFHIPQHLTVNMSTNQDQRVKPQGGRRWHG